MSALSAFLPSGTPSLSRPGTAPLDLSALVGAAGWERLPAAVRRRFATAHPDTCYAGHLDLRCSPVGRVFSRLSACFGAPLLRTSADAVPTSVRVRADGRGGVLWERRFTSADHSEGQSVRSTKELDADGRLMERTEGGLSMSLDVFEDNGTLVFCSRRYWLVLGRLRLPVPVLLSPGVCRVTHTDLGHGAFRFALSMTHPLWGQTFRQCGVFADPSHASEGALS